MPKREVISVGVSRRILWIGAEAYPLHNIARAQTIEFSRRRGLAVGRYVVAMALWVLLEVAVSTLIKKLAESRPSLSHAAPLVTVAVFGLIAFSTIRLIVKLSARRHYALIIETAGSPRAALVSDRKGVVTRLVYAIMGAIDNPQAEFQFQVENLHVGDRIQQFGNQNIGKEHR